MSSVFSHLVAAGYEALRAVTEVSVTYTRGDSTLSLNAIPTEERYSVPDEPGILTEIHSRDYLVKTSELILGGSVVEPQVGDRITETIGAVNMVFEVFPIDGARCFRYREASRGTIRVHTKRVA